MIVSCDLADNSNNKTNQEAVNTNNSKKIFIIDDEIQYLKVLSEAIKKYNNHVEIFTYSNGYIAIKDINLYQPNLIILDNDMPEISGLEICKRFSQILDGKNVLISTSNINVINDFKQIGMKNFLNKPFSIKDLIDIIDKL